MRRIDGRIINVVLTLGNEQDCAPVLALLEECRRWGSPWGDLGNGGQAAGMLGLTRAEAPEQKYLLAPVRQAIETSFSSSGQITGTNVFGRDG